MHENRESRVVQLGELRIQEDEGKRPKIVGHAAVFNSWSEDLGGFREIIAPGFFKHVLNNDVRALWNHNPEMVLGRTKNGTLHLEEDTVGLRVEIEPPDTAWARDVIVSLMRQDVDQMSFGFQVKAGGDHFDYDPEHGHIRTLLSGGCERLFDVSPVSFPAYSETSASVRSAFEAFKRSDSEGDNPEDGVDDMPGGDAEARARRRRIWVRLELAMRE